MFGKLLRHPVVIAMILLGLCIYIIQLFVTQTIALYIHPRYSWFAVIMCGIAAIILLYSLALELRHKYRDTSSGSTVVNVIVVAIVIAALALPAQALSPGAMSQRTLKTLNYDGTPMTKACPDERPETTQLWIDEMSQYPLWCYEGKSIELTGFVFEAPDSPLPANMYYLGQMVMSCCTIDLQPYGLPILKHEGYMYAPDTWLVVRGTLKKMQVQGKEQLVVAPESVQQAKKPDNPYRYIQQLNP